MYSMQAQAPEVMEDPKTPEDTDAPKIGALVQQLIMMASMLKELETQSQLIHVNYESENFLGIHAFMKERYEEHLEQFDHVAELVRSLDYWMPLCSCGLKDALPGFQHICEPDGKHMLMTYYCNLEAMGYLARSLERLAATVEAPDVQNYMADLVGSAFKNTWFLKATLRGC